MCCLVTVLLKVRAHPALDSWKKPAHTRGSTATAKSAAQFRARGKAVRCAGGLATKVGHNKVSKQRS